MLKVSRESADLDPWTLPGPYWQWHLSVQPEITVMWFRAIGWWWMRRWNNEANFVFTALDSVFMVMFSRLFYKHFHKTVVLSECKSNLRHKDFSTCNITFIICQSCELRNRNFLWKSFHLLVTWLKCHGNKVTRLSTIKDYEKGGLKMIDLKFMIKSLRLAWLKRISI